MIQFFWFLTFVVPEGICSSGGVEVSLRIAGGEPADIRNYPYQVAISLDGQMCGGTILKNSYILTAAHCTDGIHKSKIQIRAGSNYWNKDGVVVSADEVIQHPKFDPDTFDYDAAVIRLQTPLDYGVGVNSISLPDENEPIESHLLATVTGYGYIAEYGPVAKSLQKVDLPIINTEDCQQIYGEDQITERMFCAGYVDGGKDACQGDSGGPIVLDNKVIGIVSFGPSCAAPQSPSGYTKVSSLIEFINSAMNE